jgi:hypothetical protein
VNLKVYNYTLGREVVAVIAQADVETMLKVNLPHEFKGGDMLALGRRKGVLLYVASTTNSLRVAEGKMTPGLECMHAKENKLDDISHMQH